MALDTLYTVETPEGIALSLRPAGVSARLLAYLLDLLIRFGLFIAVSMVAGLMGGMGGGLVMVTLFLLEWFYPVLFELARDGATPGKRMMGLVVVMDSGLPVTPAASLTRNLLRTADFLPFMYAFAALSMLLRPDFKRLGDLAAGTLVVYREQTRLHGDIPDAVPAPPRRALSAREQSAVLAWAGRTNRLTPQRLQELAELAASIMPPPDDPTAPAGASTRLAGVAQWLLGRRQGAAP